MKSTQIYCDCTEEISSSHIVWELWGKDSHRSNALKRSYSHRFLYCLYCLFYGTCGTITLINRQPNLKSQISPNPTSSSLAIANHQRNWNTLLWGVVTWDQVDELLLDADKRQPNAAALPHVTLPSHNTADGPTDRKVLAASIWPHPYHPTRRPACKHII